jgi:hypothetical protein
MKEKPTMKRDPSIHIKLSDFEDILLKVLPFTLPKDIPGIARAILKLSRPHAVNTRMISVTTERLEKKVNKILTSTTKDADLMARMIYAARIRAKHRGVQQIKPSTRDWGMVKEIANLANAFCMDFNMGKKEGYLRYIELAAQKMKSFNISRISSMHESICRTHEALFEIAKDPYPEFTEQVHQYYRVKVAKKTGIINNFRGEPDKYVFFVRASALIKQLTVPIIHFIDAQFEAMEYRNSMPEPAQLIGQKAKERLNKYLYERSIRI